MAEVSIGYDRRIEILRDIPVFSNLDDEAISELASLLEEHTARSQEPLFKKGEAGEKMYILVEGEVRVHDGNHVIARLSAGEVFGEYALIDQENRSASVTMEKAGKLLILSRNSLGPFITKHPELLLGLLQSQVKRMRDMNVLEEKLSKSYLKISRQKQEIEQQNDAIKQQKATLEQQNLELASLNNQRKQLLSVMIHGVKNPMTSALMMLGMLEQQSDSKAEQTEYLSVLKQSLLRMDKLIGDLIRANQLEQSMTLQQGKTFVLDALVEEILLIQGYLARQKQLIITKKLGSASIFSNESNIFQLIDKTISSAIELANKSTEVLVETKLDGKDQVVFTTALITSMLPHDKMTNCWLSFQDISIEHEEEISQNLQMIAKLAALSEAKMKCSYDENELLTITFVFKK